MPSPPKTFFHNSPYEICTSVQTELPLVATDHMKLLIEGVLGAAQTHGAHVTRLQIEIGKYRWAHTGQ